MITSHTKIQSSSKIEELISINLNNTGPPCLGCLFSLSLLFNEKDGRAL